MTGRTRDPRPHLLSEAGERALELALRRAGRQVTFREIAAAWGDANEGFSGIARSRTSWTAVFISGVRAGRVVVTRTGFLPYYTLRDGPDYPVPAAAALRETRYRREISDAAEKAIVLAQKRLQRQVTWSEIQDAWPEANNVQVAPFPELARAGRVTEPGRQAGRIVMVRSGGFTYYTLSTGPEYPLASKRPQYTAARLQLAATGEAALAVALRRAGHQVQWEQVAAAWKETQPAGSRRSLRAKAPYVLLPSLERASVLRTVCGRAVFFTLAEQRALPLPPEKPKYTAFRLADCATAELALELALDRAGTQVSWREVRAAWPSAKPATRVPEDRGQPWSRIFEPAVAMGRVSRTQSGCVVYYGLTHRPQYQVPNPVPGPRVVSEPVGSRVQAVLQVLTAATQLRGTMVQVAEVHATWDASKLGQPTPTPKTLVNDLELASGAGAVRRVKQNRHTYYAPSTNETLSPPIYASDLNRVEVALCRALSRLNSAVLVTEVEREIEADPKLHIRSGALVAGVLSHLRQCDRVRTIDHLGRNRGSGYWSVCGGPHWVRPEAEHHFDRRYRAVLGLWRASHGRPFTTKAVRLYALARLGLQTQDRHLMAWTNALTQFRDNGDLVAVRVVGSRYRRWAVAADWSALLPAEQEERLRDLYGRDVVEDSPSAPSCVALVAATIHDVAFESTNGNMRTLVLVAKAMAGAREFDPERRRILRSRPVTLEDVKSALGTRPALTPDRPLRKALAQAMKLTRGGHPVLESLGVVSCLRYVDLRATPAGQAYVDYRRALLASYPKNAFRRLRRLQCAANDSTLGVVPLPVPVLDARAHLLGNDLRQRVRTLVAAARRAELLPEEAGEAVQRAKQLRSWAFEAAALASGPPEPCPSDASVETAGLLPRAASQQVRGLLDLKQGDATIGGRVAVAGKVAPDAATVHLQKEHKRRSLKYLIDRVGFACYCTARYGGPSLASLAQEAWHAMGELRTPLPFRATLLNPTATARHTAAAAVLGFYDDKVSRAVLLEYLQRFISNLGRVGEDTTVVAAETAVLGLARLPFGAVATELTRDEHRVLLEVSARGIDERVQTVARRVVRSWDESWDRDRLLFL